MAKNKSMPNKLQKWINSLTPKKKKLARIAGKASREIFNYNHRYCGEQL